MKKIKTNVLRLLDQAHIPYYIKEFDYDDHGKPINGRCEMDISEDRTFKTLVLKGTKGHLVCCIPVIYEIDLKKLGSETGNKSVEMILQRELLPLTGYKSRLKEKIGHIDDNKIMNKINNALGVSFGLEE